MTTDGGGPDEPRGLLEAQIGLILSGITDVEDGLEGAAAYPPDWAELSSAGYLFRKRALLVRDVDVDRVMAIVLVAPVEDENKLGGLTRLTLLDDEARSVEEVCTAVDRVLGEGVATPDHVLYVCPAADPEEVPSGLPPDPSVSTAPGDGYGALVAVLDSGVLPDAAGQHSWLAGVTDCAENPCCWR